MKEFSRLVFRMSPFHIFMIVLCAAFFCELSIMMFLEILPPLPQWGVPLFDASLLSVLISPIIYFCIFCPFTAHITERKQAEAALQRAHDGLEQRVMDRTKDLQRLNKELRTEITERNKAVEALRESEERYRAVTQSAKDAIITVNSDGTIMGWNLSAESMFGYPEAEVLGQQLDLIVPHQFRADFHDGLKRVQAGGARRVIGETVEPVGLCKNGSEFQMELSLSQWEMPNGYYYTSIIRDITERKKAEERLKETVERLRKAVGTTIQVLESAVEARDPYTSGHQFRSTNLARTIATEMGLPQDKIDGVRMAGSIHDIGKLSIPAEILSKPAKLSELEFSLIKIHTRKGYEILKDVESPWPLAEIVLQHHERMDGSGYPRNLKGEEILIEARILAVADVVEAMASHRPQRPSLGIDAALAEIEKNRGILYDNAAADACLRLFQEKGYKLTEIE